MLGIKPMQPVPLHYDGHIKEFAECLKTSSVTLVCLPYAMGIAQWEFPSMGLAFVI